MSTKRTLGVGYFFALIAVVAIICSVMAGWIVRNSSMKRTDYDAHLWLHDQLRLTEDQEHRLEPTETRFATARKAYVEEMRAANRDLAEAIRSDAKYSPKVEAAIERIHRAQGDFQKATIRHCLEMQESLTPEQSKRLLEITSDALSHNAD